MHLYKTGRVFGLVFYGRLALPPPLRIASVFMCPTSPVSLLKKRPREIKAVCQAHVETVAGAIYSHQTLIYQPPEGGWAAPELHYASCISDGCNQEMEKKRAVICHHPGDGGIEMLNKQQQLGRGGKKEYCFTVLRTGSLK